MLDVVLLLVLSFPRNHVFSSAYLYHLISSQTPTCVCVCVFQSGSRVRKLLCRNDQVVESGALKIVFVACVA